VEKIKVDIPKYYPFLKPSSANDWETFCKNDLPVLLSEEISRETTQELQSVYRALVRGSYRGVTAATESTNPPTVFNKDRSNEKEVNRT